MTMEIAHFPITHAGIRRVSNPALGAEAFGRTAVRYLRFLRHVRVERLELSPLVYGRWVPAVPTHPAQIVVSSLDETDGQWRVVREVELPYNPAIAGEGLSQDMSTEEIDAHFRKAMQAAKPAVIPVEVAAKALRVECGREHPTWPNHGECNGGLFNVPFGALDSLKAFGSIPEEEIPSPSWLPILSKGTIDPVAPRGMSVRHVGEMLLFQGRKLSIGFSLRRPVILHLGWDDLGMEMAGLNRVSARRVRFKDQIRGISGPLLVDFDGDYGSHRWTGSVEAKGNRVTYRYLRSVRGLSIDAVFDVYPDRIDLELGQSAQRDLPVIEAEGWRFAFSMARGMTGVAGVPTMSPGRSGDVELPAFLAGDGNGALSVRVAGGDQDRVRLQVESYRSTYEVTAGLLLGERPSDGRCLIVPRGTVKARIELAVTSFEPASRSGAGEAGTGIRRHWTSVFSCFRPEWGGFANNAVSVNCHVNQHGPIEIAAFTRRPAATPERRGIGSRRPARGTHEPSGPDPIALARFTVGRSLMDGSGYGYWRNLYRDSDPVLLAAAGRLHQARPDLAWLQSVLPGLTQAVKRILDTMDPETGLSLCLDLSGNSGSFRWSCNAWDVVGFGHLDAYVNAWTYRALRNAAALLDELGVAELSGRCREAAALIRENYARQLLNPETGWVACWRSRDGKLHDYASPFINGPACAFGALGSDDARRALEGLERLRDELGIRCATLGIPFMLRPIDPADHMLPRLMGGGVTEPTFENFTDGSMGSSAATYYLRALSIHGFKDRAAAMAGELDGAFANGLFTGPPGGAGEGREFLTWEGMSSGYEGTFGPSFGVLYAIAVEQRVLEPPDPEWWPANG